MAYEYKAFSEFHVGDRVSFSRTITEADVANFAGVTGDFNPIHIDEVYAKKTMFGKRIAHGVLVASLFGPAGSPFFGMGSIYVGHTQRFLAPVYIGDTVTAIVEVKELRPHKQIIVTHSYVVNQDGKMVIDGEQILKIIEPSADTSPAEN